MEVAPQDNYTSDSKQKFPPAILRRAPGITAFASDTTQNPARGAWMMGGVEYVVIGPNLYEVLPSYTPGTTTPGYTESGGDRGGGIPWQHVIPTTITAPVSSSLTLVATGIQGNGIVRMTDNKYCLVILVPNVATYTYTAGNGLSVLNLPTPALDCWFMDSYIVFLQTNGLGFFNDDGQIASGTGPITFNYGNQFLREYGTDPFVGMMISNRNVYMMGQRTSEVFVDTGSTSTVGTPFADAPNGFIQIGMLPGAQYSGVVQNNTVFWLAQDRTFRTLNGVAPVRISNHGIEGMLAGLDVTGCFGMAYSVGGHLMVAWTFPAADAALTLVYDCTTAEWHKMSSFGLGCWRPLFCHSAFGKYLVGDSQAGGVGYLDMTALTEWGTPRMSTWTHQAVYNENNRISHRRLELVLGGGFAPFSGAPQDVKPYITLKVSDDGGVTFRAFPDRSLGSSGQYTQRMIWFGLGISRQRVYQFELSAAADSWVTDLVGTVEGGKW